MKSFNVALALALALPLLAALSQAAPAAPAPAQLSARQSAAQITFQGAPQDDAFFVQSFPGDGTIVQITNPLSISHIASSGGATCTFYGIDGSVTTTVGAQTVDVGPPQTQISGACRDL